MPDLARQPAEAAGLGLALLHGAQGASGGVRGLSDPVQSLDRAWRRGPDFHPDAGAAEVLVAI